MAEAEERQGLAEQALEELREELAGLEKQVAEKDSEMERLGEEGEKRFAKERKKLEAMVGGLEEEVAGWKAGGRLWSWREERFFGGELLCLRSGTMLYC